MLSETRLGLTHPKKRKQGGARGVPDPRNGGGGVDKAAPAVCAVRQLPREPRVRVGGVRRGPGRLSALLGHPLVLARVVSGRHADGGRHRLQRDRAVRVDGQPGAERVRREHCQLQRWPRRHQTGMHRRDRQRGTCTSY